MAFSRDARVLACVRSAPSSKSGCGGRTGSGQGEFCLPDHRFVRRRARKFVDFREEQASVVPLSARRFSPTVTTGGAHLQRTRRSFADWFAPTLALIRSSDRSDLIVRCLARTLAAGGTFDSLDEPFFTDPDPCAEGELFRGTPLARTRRGEMVMMRADVCAQCALAAHAAQQRQPDNMYGRAVAHRASMNSLTCFTPSLHARASSGLPARKSSARRTDFRFVIQSAECAATHHRAGCSPTTPMGAIIQNSSRGREKRLSLKSGRCTFAGSRVTQPSEVAGQDVRLAHLVTTDSAA